MTVTWETFNTEVEQGETCWILDPAVDLGQADVLGWFEKGGVLQPRPQEKLSKIRYRGLYPPEVYEATLRAHRADPHKIDNRVQASAALSKLFVECARFGIVEVEGLNLEKEWYNGVKGIASSDILKLSTWSIPPKKPEPPEGLSPDQLEVWSPPPAPDGGWCPPQLEGIAGYPFLNWIGGLISSLSFRGNGRSRSSAH